MDTQLGRRTGLLDALSYALVAADLAALAVWTWDFFVTPEIAIFDTTRSFFAFAWVIILLGCLSVAFLLRVGHRQRRRVSMTCLQVSSWLLVLPLVGYAWLLAGIEALSNFPK